MQEIIKATDSTIHDIVYTELDRLGLDADLNHIDVSEVTDMSELFCEPSNELFWGESFRGDISKWDVSKVEDISNMFSINGWGEYCGDLSKWDVSNVKNMTDMGYTGDVSQWNNPLVKDRQFVAESNFRQPPKSHWFRTSDPDPYYFSFQTIIRFETYEEMLDMVNKYNIDTDYIWSASKIRGEYDQGKNSNLLAGAHHYDDPICWVVADEPFVGECYVLSSERALF